jgi:hypothetical protein
LNATTLALNTATDAPVGITAYHFALPKTHLTGTFTVACANNSLEYTIRRDGTPAIEATKYTCAKPAVLNYPRNGIL